MSARELRAGDFVKVVRDGQRMWFKVLAVDGLKVTATLANEPVSHIEGRKLPAQSKLVYGDLVSFPFSEVIDVQASDASEPTEKTQ